MTPNLRTTILAAAGVGLMGAGVLSWKLVPSYRQRAESRVKLVDDFNDGKNQNLIGGESFLQTSTKAQLSAARQKPSTPSPGGGLACALSYDLPKGHNASWGTGLNDLDISAAKTLTFWLKADQTPLPELRVELVDSLGAKEQVRLSHLSATTRWQRVTIPAQAFPGVDFNRHARFILQLSAPKQPLKGTLYLDDLAFIGPPNVFFRSLEDNIYRFPRRLLVNPRRLLDLPREQMLWEIARDTWGYFRDLVDTRHHLPLNSVQVAPNRQIGDYASTTDIAMYLMSVVSAHDLDLIDYHSMVERIRGTLAELDRLPKWHNFFYNYYNTTNLQITSQYISSVDNAWLAAALIVVRQAVPELLPQANRLLKAMDFGEFYDPHNGQMHLGYEIKAGRFAPYHYGLLATESRIISMVAIGKGDVSEDHWFRIYRTLPKEWTWQRQIPAGTYKSYLGHDIFQGYYTYDDGAGRTVQFVPSWGGSLFEFLMPTLVVDERQLAPQGLGLNDQRVVEVHRSYALQKLGFPVWGLSPCSTPVPVGGYNEFGVAALGAKGYEDHTVVTPHSSILAIAFEPEQVIENIRRLLTLYPMYGEYGFYDAVEVQHGLVAYRYLALDEGMILIALNNYLNHGAIQRRFAADHIMKRVEPLLQVEQFFDGNANVTASTQQ